MFNQSFFENITRFETNKEKLTIRHWMKQNPPTITASQTVHDAAKLLKNEATGFLPVLNDKQQPIGIITTEHIIDAFLNGEASTTRIDELTLHHEKQIYESIFINNIFPFTNQRFLVIDDQGALVGILTEKEMLNGLVAFMERYIKDEKISAILHVILERAYEGVAVVDENGVLIEFNNAYSNFTGIPRDEAIGKHVTEVIENTGLHQTVKKGIPDRGVLQNIQGQDMVVHRIPIWSNGKVVAAIGMLIFEGVSEVYRIYERLLMQKATKEIEGLNQNAIASFDQIVGGSEKTAELKRIARKASRTRVNVLISGELGTGKKTYAESIHQLSPFATEPFINVNCQLITEEDLETELFGTNKAYGKFALANNGTIYLNAIDSLPMDIQLKVLQVLQEGKIEIGLESHPVNARVIASSTKDLTQLIEENKFNANLYHELNVIKLGIPPLRERREDIPILLSYLMKEVCFKHQIPEKTFASATVKYLMDYKWPGNIHEMLNVIEKLVTLVSGDIVEHTDLPNRILKHDAPASPKSSETTLEQLKEKQDQNERELILSFLEQTGGNKSKTAELLGIHRTTLYQRLKRLDIDT